MVAIPSTFTSVERDRKIRAHIIGQLARFLGMYRVTHVLVYYDEDPYFDSHALGKYIVKTLKYAVTPPWLKKEAFPLEETDRYWGAIPPLQIQAHQKEGNVGWGVVKDGKLLWKGEKRPADEKELKKKGYGRKTPQLVAVKNGKVIDPYTLNREDYNGFWPVYFNKPLPDLIKHVRKRFDAYVIGTDRDGEYLGDVAERVRKGSKSKDVLIVFGGHHRGITEMKGFGEGDYDVIISLFRRQETKSVRTEEAVPLVLEALHRSGIYEV